MMERIDELGRGGRVIIQDTGLFCFGVDAVLLAWFAKLKKGERALDLCAGNGIVPILMEARYGGRYVAVEILGRSAGLARRSVEMNGTAGAIEVIHGDIRRIGEILPAAAFDAVTCNPPYLRVGAGKGRDGAALETARREVDCALSDVCAAMGYALRDKGRAYFVHRAERLADLVCGLRAAGLEPKRLRFVESRAGEAPKLVLLEARKGGGRDLAVEPAVVLYGADGGYTKETMDIYYG